MAPFIGIVFRLFLSICLTGAGKTETLFASHLCRGRIATAYLRISRTPFSRCFCGIVFLENNFSNQTENNVSRRTVIDARVKIPLLYLSPARARPPRAYNRRETGFIVSFPCLFISRTFLGKRIVEALLSLFASPRPLYRTMLRTLYTRARLSSQRQQARRSIAPASFGHCQEWGLSTG